MERKLSGGGIFNRVKQRMAEDWGVVLCVLTAVVIAAWYGGLAYQGDDLVYQNTFASGEGFGHGIWPLWKLVNFWGFHWVYVNGRFGDKLAAVSLGAFPQWVNAIFAGVMAGIMMVMVLRLSGLYRKSGWQVLSTVVVSVYVFVFPWWDTMLYIVCGFNYVCATALQLLFVWFFVERSSEREYFGWRRMLLLAAAFLAGGMHEAATGPIMVGVFWWLWCNGKGRDLSKFRRLLLGAYVAGVAVVTFAPSIISRAGDPGMPDDTLGWLVLKSVPLTLVLILVLLGMLLNKNGRQELYRRVKEPWAIWVIAAIGSIVFICLGGRVGRSGWFSQTYALIALCQLVVARRWRINRSLGVVLCVLMSALVFSHGIGLAARLHRGGKIDHEARQLIAGNPGGVIYFDFPSSGDEPWWTLGRVRLFKPYDSYSRSYLGLWNAAPANPVILPCAARGIDWDDFKGSDLEPLHGTQFRGIRGVELPDGVFISDGCPPGTVNSGIEWFDDDEHHLMIGDREFVGVHFTCGGRTFYVWYPRYFELGERSVLQGCR